ncbi:MAG: hypothetical protein N2321_06930 [Melioribacteraceae bacterium]|nr:hypothetical protein [Melioribacteraceae bacterium]
MIIQRVEKFRNDLLSIIPKIDNETKIISINSFFKFLFETRNNILIESYAFEFIQIFVESIEKQNTFYTNPNKIDELILSINNLLTFSFFNNFHSKLISSKNKLTQVKTEIISNLENNFELIHFDSKLNIPFIGKICTNELNLTFSKVEGFNLKLLVTKSKSSINIIPNYLKNELLEEQIKISFDLAKDYLKSYLPKDHNYDLIINFNNSLANYNGNSIGLALTIGLIIELTNIHNLPIKINIQNKIALTGAVDNAGNTSPIEEDILKQKIEAVFFSPINIFVLPNSNEPQAKHFISELNKYYPNRKLKLVFVDSFIDILERRSIIEIQKKTFVQRAVKHTASNWVMYLMVLVFLLMTLVFIRREFDYNPVKYDFTSNLITFKNSSNITLFSLKDFFDVNNKISEDFLMYSILFIDVNKDGINEILYCFQDLCELSDSLVSQGIALLDNKGKVIWKRKFEKYLTSDRENLRPPYSFKILDTISINNNICVFLNCNNGNSYSNGIFILDLLNNKIISDTLWCFGSVNKLMRIKNKNNEELLYIVSLNNSYEKACLTILKSSELKGQIPATKEYSYHNIPKAKILKSFLLPKSDFLNYYNYRNCSLAYFSTRYNNSLNEIIIITFEDNIFLNGIIYTYNFKNDFFYVDIGNYFRVNRDSLVAKGILKKPFTDTKEYREILRKQILAWNGTNYIPIDEYYKKGVNHFD